MDGLFWMQAYGNKRELLRGIGDPNTRRYVEMNYGPWDRLQDNAPFVVGAGANLPDVTSDEAAAAVSEERGEALRSPTPSPAGRRGPSHRTLSSSRRNLTAQNSTKPLPWPMRFRVLMLNDNGPATVGNEKPPSTLSSGPSKRMKTSFSATKPPMKLTDAAWSARLARYAHMQLQKGLPVPAAYKRESPGTGPERVRRIYYAGDSNAGAKTIAINLPNDEEVQLKTGARRLSSMPSRKSSPHRGQAFSHRRMPEDGGHGAF